MGKVLEGEIFWGICLVGRWRLCGFDYYVENGFKRKDFWGNGMFLGVIVKNFDY